MLAEFNKLFQKLKKKTLNNSIKTLKKEHIINIKNIQLLYDFYTRACDASYANAYVHVKIKM